MVWDSAWDWAWLPCFPKSICRNRSSRGARRRGQEEGGLGARHLKRPGSRFLWPSPLVLRIRAGARARSARPAREAGRRGRPKNSGPVQSVPSSRHPRVDFVSELGLDLGMGSVLHRSSKHNTSSASVRQPVSLAVCVRCPAAQALALDLLLCGACHGHRFYMILLMSSAVPPSHRTRTRACARGALPLCGAVLLYRTDCGSVRPLYCIRTALHAVQQHPRQSRSSVTSRPALVADPWVHLFCFLPALPCLASLAPFALFASPRPNRSCPSRGQAGVILTGPLRYETIVLVQPHGQQTVTWAHHLMLASSGASQRFPCEPPARSWDGCRVCDWDGALDRRLSPSSCQTATQPS